MLRTPNAPKYMPLSRRAEIRLGFRCNARCGFCYYQDLLDNPKEQEPRKSTLEDMLVSLRRLGALEVEFTGGEPTIRPDLLELVVRARQLGFSNVSLVTNGLRASSARYVNQLAEAGVNDVLLSVHGHSAAVHDEHTAIPGSYGRILQAAKNFHAAGIRVRISSTITGRNFRYATEILNQSLSLHAQCIHLAVFSPASQAIGSQHRFFVSYSDASEAIKRAIDSCEESLPPLSVKYIPFCFMQGYEKYVMNFYQQSYDPDDWNYYLSNRIRRAPKGIRGLVFDTVSLMGMLWSREWHVPMRHGLEGLKVHGFTRLVELLRKKRIPACKRCRYDRVCDHVWKDYVSSFGVGEISPVAGEKLRDPAWSYVMSRYRRPGESVTTAARVHEGSP